MIAEKKAILHLISRGNPLKANSLKINFLFSNKMTNNKNLFTNSILKKGFSNIDQKKNIQTTEKNKTNTELSFLNKITSENSLNSSNNNSSIPISKPSIETEEQYIPEYFKSYSLKVIDSVDIDEILHNTEKEGVLYKYGIPVKNTIFRPNSLITNLSKEEIEETLTSTENIFKAMELDKDSAYESLILKYDETYNNEIDMYGSKIPAGEIQHEVFQYGVPIPMQVLKDERIMKQIRQFYKYNIDFPGNVDDVNPMKFEPNLKPVEEFRYTPIAPISEKEITEHKKKIEERKRKAEFFEVDKKRVKFYLFAICFGLIIYKTILLISKEGEKMNYEVEKLRLRRYRYREDDDFY